jgi:hypothetical protein
MADGTLSASDPCYTSNRAKTMSVDYPALESTLACRKNIVNMCAVTRSWPLRGEQWE